MPRKSTEGWQKGVNRELMGSMEMKRKVYFPKESRSRVLITAGKSNKREQKHLLDLAVRKALVTLLKGEGKS